MRMLVGGPPSFSLAAFTFVTRDSLPSSRSRFRFPLPPSPEPTPEFKDLTFFFAWHCLSLLILPLNLSPNSQNKFPPKKRYVFSSGPHALTAFNPHTFFPFSPVLLIVNILPRKAKRQYFYTHFCLFHFSPRQAVVVPLTDVQFSRDDLPGFYSFVFFSI